MLATALQVCGIAACAVGAALIALPAGIVVAGVGAILFGLALERD